MQEAEYNQPLVQSRGEPMQSPEDVVAIGRLKACGWGTKRIAAELGISRNTVKRYLRQGGWAPYASPQRMRALDGVAPWLRERFMAHAGNAAVVQQELRSEHGITVSLRTVERACAPWRRELAACAQATVRFETPPGQQMQIDFGSRKAQIAGAEVGVQLFVATLGHSRRIFVQAFPHQHQSAWFAGIEAALQHFGGVPRQVLVDNARALVEHHDAASREVVFNDRFRALAHHWGFRPVACAPYRPRTKGKDERSVGYVKRNAMAGHTFESWAHLQAHLDWWMREVADQRVHGTTGEIPAERFRLERLHLMPLADRPPFEQTRSLSRRVARDATVEVDTNRYSVPWRLAGRLVQVHIAGCELRVLDDGREVACHPELAGRRQTRCLPEHLQGIVGYRAPGQPSRSTAPGDQVQGPIPVVPQALLQRDLSVYEAITGGGWQ
ncbi:IS21 family transposase [Castellaniella defragrans]|uniref:Transposase n=1 Tax=Castellaniella defragrans TaxID=75697 RepID=A0A7W9WQF7_CASDE|nr:IS21 family transposase [Castellaniella defragrans]KAB0594805.1 IS21 family transposase [Castellaniella defragrans]MBB6085548.1 transposase [Castellaniella defragrans]